MAFRHSFRLQNRIQVFTFTFWLALTLMWHPWAQADDLIKNADAKAPDCVRSLTHGKPLVTAQDWVMQLQSSQYQKSALALGQALKHPSSPNANTLWSHALNEIFDFMQAQNHRRKVGDDSILHLAGSRWFATAPELRASLTDANFVRRQEDIFITNFVVELLPKIENTLQLEALRLEAHRLSADARAGRPAVRLFLPPPGGHYQLDNYAQLFETIANIQTPEQLQRYKESRWIYANVPSLSWYTLDRYVITGELVQPLSEVHWMGESPLRLENTDRSETLVLPQLDAILEEGGSSVAEATAILSQLRKSYDEFRKSKFGLQHTFARWTGILSSDTKDLEERRQAHVRFEAQLRRAISVFGYGPLRTERSVSELVLLSRQVAKQFDPSNDTHLLNQDRRSELALLNLTLQSYLKTAILIRLTTAPNSVSQKDLEALTYEDFVGHDSLGPLIGLIANRRLESMPSR